MSVSISATNNPWIKGKMSSFKRSIRLNFAVTGILFLGTVYLFIYSLQHNVQKIDFDMLGVLKNEPTPPKKTEVVLWIYDTIPDLTQRAIIKKKKDPFPTRQFDPKFTLGLYLLAIGEHKTVPFHWYDWTDLTILDSAILTRPGSKPGCRSFRAFQKELDAFCSENDSQGTTDIGVNVFTCPSNHMSTDDVATAGLSFLYMNAPNPTKLIFLTNSLTVEVEVSEKQRVDDSGIMDLVLGGKEQILVDLSKELNRLSKKHSSIPIDSPTEKSLPLDAFTFDVAAKIAELSSKRDSLSSGDKKYLEALEYSEHCRVNDKGAKHFSEPLIKGTNLGLHHDWRFYKRLNTKEYEKRAIIHRLVRTWLDFTSKVNINTWVAHGSLMAWHWNGMMFPWDDDIDVQMPIEDLHKLARNYNQSLIIEDLNEGHGRYILDIGAFITERTKGDNKNNIDARFIDIDSGMYIDITALSTSIYEVPERYKDTPKNQVFNCRNNHFAAYDQISPLAKTVVEGKTGYIPAGYPTIISFEYKFGLHEKEFNGWYFVEALQMWIRSRDLHNFIQFPEIWLKFHNFVEIGNEELTAEIKYTLTTHEKYELTREEMKIVDSMTSLDFEDLFVLQDIYVEYLLSKDVTGFHYEETKRRNAGLSCSALFSGFQEFSPIRLEVQSFRERSAMMAATN